jgi:predicted ribosomally synthesized peptide with SipW-like signal peptide
MKTKSLFISTIAMIVVLVVALSVGTFAWYTSQETVSANDSSIGAALSTSTAIGIDWENSAAKSSVTLGSDVYDPASLSGGLRPMIPITAPANGAFPEFNEAILKLDGSEYKVASKQVASPWTQKSNDTTPKTTLFVRNLDTVKGVNVYPIVDIGATGEGNLNALLRVAIWVEDADLTYKYMGTWGSGNAYAADVATYVDQLETAITTAEPTNEFLLTADGVRATSQVTFQLSANQPKQVYIYAWLEGTALTTAKSDLTAANFDVTFHTAGQINPQINP